MNRTSILLNLSKSAYQLFVEEHPDEFAAGWKCSECYLEYRSFAQMYGFAISSSTTFGKNIRDMVERKRIRNKYTESLDWVYIAKGTKIAE